MNQLKELSCCGTLIFGGENFVSNVQHRNATPWMRMSRTQYASESAKILPSMDGRHSAYGQVQKRQSNR
uniref:Uncharacterized protein n=1 Tax=Anopheles minimus TaxID=112268 RepID=A0A182VYG4_9DIPT